MDHLNGAGGEQVKNHILMCFGTAESHCSTTVSLRYHALMRCGGNFVGISAGASLNEPPPRMAEIFPEFSDDFFWLSPPSQSSPILRPFIAVTFKNISMDTFT